MIVLDLCGGTGSWSKPYRDAGYDVRLITLPEYDVRSYVPPARVTGVLAAPPCTEFSLAKQGERDYVSGLAVVDACLRIVWRTRPEFWALENPRGMLSKWLGPPALEFEPWEFGDAWTKRTCLWGEFRPPQKNPVEPVAGICELAHDSLTRAVTPPGFARAFFTANNPGARCLIPVDDRPRCRWCGEVLDVSLYPLHPGRRRDTRFCSDACRQAAYRFRHGLRVTPAGESRNELEEASLATETCNCQADLFLPEESHNNQVKA